MFDWINFAPQRFLRPSVLAGMILAAVFLMVTLLAGVIDSAVNESRKKNNKEELAIGLSVRIIGLIGIFTGALTVLLTV